MSTDTEIQSEIDALKARFTETKALYREVCALLFFRYGITPTGSKLYQYVRKGSMNAPADALALFWKELRSKARVQIDHPDLPEALKIATAEAVQVLWGQATELARADLAALRIESQSAIQQAATEMANSEARCAALEVQSQTRASQLVERADQLRQVAAELEAERRTHVGTAARVQELQTQVSSLQQQLVQARTDFSEELAKGRAAIDATTERATAAERKALLEIDQVRTSKSVMEKQLDSARKRLIEVENKHRAQDLEVTASAARTGAELDAAKIELHRLNTAASQRDQDLVRSQQEVTQYMTQAKMLRELVDQFKVTSSKSSCVKQSKSAR
mgnify:CR=1 FL=1